jgi:hypothetical protein
MLGLPSTEQALGETYRIFARYEAAGNSAIYENLCLGIADDPRLLARIQTLPVPKRQPNLLLASARVHGAPMESYPDFAVFAHENWPAISEMMLARRTQTNEPGRCAALLPLLARIPGPLALIEVGASAGLCLYPDRYGYSYSGRRLGDGPPIFPCEVDGPVPATRLPEVVWRAGLDLNPLDVTSDADVAWLEALVWPGQTGRLDRLRQAIAIARQDPPHLVKGDLLTDLGPLAAQAPPEATLIVFHTSVLGYVEDARRGEFTQQVRELPGHWISNEAPGVMHDAGVPTAKTVLAFDDQPVAWASPHGQSFGWLTAT